MNLYSLFSSESETEVDKPVACDEMALEKENVEEEDEIEVQTSMVSTESGSEEPIVLTETTIALTSSSRKSMVAQFFVKDNSEAHSSESVSIDPETDVDQADEITVDTELKEDNEKEMVAMLYRIISSLSTDQVEDLLSQFETELMLQSQNGKYFSFQNRFFDTFRFLFT